MDLHLRQDLRSLAVHEAALRVLQAHPESAEGALQVDHWDTVDDPASKPLRDEWHCIIENKLWVHAVEDCDRGQQLRQASPLGFVLDDATRSAILERYRRR